MAVVNKNVLQTVLSILGTTPDDSIKSDAWVEIFKLQLALKGLASAIDSLREKNKAISQGQTVTYQTVGNVEYALYLQDLTKVQVMAGATIAAGLGVRFVPNGVGGILAYPCHKAYKMDAFCEAGASAGSVGEFILKGFVGYSKYTVYKTGTTSIEGQGSGVPGVKERSHYRLSTHYLYTADGYWAWYEANYLDGKFSEYATRNYVAVAVGNNGGAWLSYFNPERY